jgi:bacteriochlorophyll C8 methyltransferase
LLILSHLGRKQGLIEKIIHTSFLPSITLEQLISITPDKYEIDIIDERTENIDFKWDGNLVGISTQTLSANRAYNIADEFRKNGKTVVLGGNF